MTAIPHQITTTERNECVTSHVEDMRTQQPGMAYSFHIMCRLASVDDELSSFINDFLRDLLNEKEDQHDDDE